MCWRFQANGIRSTAMLRRALLLCVLAVSYADLLPEPAFPQGETTSAIIGQVSDTSGAAVPGATVTISNKETGLKRSATTDSSGRFSFPQLNPGTYSVTVEALGFETQQNGDV